MQAGNGAVVCAVLPAGNANDHRRATREQPLADAIVTGSVTRIDLLRLTVEGTSPTTRYAHSYIGLGLTPVVAVDLQKGGKGSAKKIHMSKQGQVTGIKCQPRTWPRPR